MRFGVPDPIHFRVSVVIKAEHIKWHLVVLLPLSFFLSPAVFQEIRKQGMRPVEASQDEVMEEKTPLVEMTRPLLGFSINGLVVLARIDMKELHTLVERTQLRHGHRNGARHIRCHADKMKI